MLTEHGPSQETAVALADCPGPWTEQLADAVLAQFGRALRAGQPPRWLHLLLPLAARKLPAEGLRDHAAELREALAVTLRISISQGTRLQRRHLAPAPARGPADIPARFGDGAIVLS
jgi:hypothetical protein